MAQFTRGNALEKEKKRAKNALCGLWSKGEDPTNLFLTSSEEENETKEFHLFFLVVPRGDGSSISLSKFKI